MHLCRESRYLMDGLSLGCLLRLGAIPTFISLYILYTGIRTMFIPLYTPFIVGGVTWELVRMIWFDDLIDQ